MSLSRRRFLRSSLAISTGFWGLKALTEGLASAADEPKGAGRYGPLVSDPKGVFDLPKGFSYQIIARRGDEMADGLLVPGQPDGMASFKGPDGLTLVVCNHELAPSARGAGPFGPKLERLDKIDRKKIFDLGEGKTPSVGGTTTIVFDTKRQKVVRQYLSLAGTQRNCAGGPTPWGTWLTCEETAARAGETVIKGKRFTSDHDHGYVFEVAPHAEIKPTTPVPLKAMGRFSHEAVAVDRKTGIVYLTEDRGDGLIYRFLPQRAGHLAEGGRLQALAVVGHPGRVTSNRDNKQERIKVGEKLDVQWIDLDDIESPKDDLRQRGFKASAASFARGEGMWAGTDAIYFACTSGGRAELGQVWRYTPSASEGKEDERKQPGKLQLFIEPNDITLLCNADNLTVAPWGEVIICENRKRGTPHRLVCATPAGEIYHLAAHPSADNELAGANFSPDGSTLFINIQDLGLTLAVTGPWQG